MPSMDIHDALARLVLQLEANGRSSHTIEQYRRHIGLLARWGAQEGLSGDVAAFGHEVLARFLASPLARTRADGRPRKTSSMNALRSRLRGFFGYLREAGVLAEDPSRLIRPALCGPAPPRALSEASQERLLATLAASEGPTAERDHALFHLLLGTGIRLGSALALRVEDLDLEAGEIRLRQVKGGRHERVFLPPPVREHLGRFLAGRAEGLVFGRADGGGITTRQARRRLRQWLERSGAEPSSPHALRHAFAMRLYRRTRDLLLVRRALGHASVASSLRYARVEDEELRAAMIG